MGSNLKPGQGDLGQCVAGRGLKGCEECHRAAVVARLCRVYKQTRSVAGPQPPLAAGVVVRKGVCGGDGRRAAVATGLRRVYRPPRSVGGPSQPRLAAALLWRQQAVGQPLEAPAFPFQNGMSSSAKLLSASPPPAGLSGPAAGGCAGAGPALAAGLPGESPAPLRLSNICISLATTSVV